ncbi:hypothetical protein [uncultured Treponema sp.]|uniref:hypothetical protein n=1 Tax=uncultured Treponema sp. TaxID=162155 RepID=UPI0015BD3593|nr:hypothetical protein [uncultured Treponema sp.]
MAKISIEGRELFNSKIAPYKDKINTHLEKEKEVLALIEKEKVSSGYKKLFLCENQIYLSTIWITINNLSVEILKTKNNDALNDARKCLYKAIIHLEEVVTATINCAYSEIEDKLAAIENTPLEKRFYLVKKLGLAIQLLIEAYGENTKWKWSFVELQGRFCTVAKNLIPMKQACKDYFDPRSSDYDNTVYYIRLVLKLLDQSATQYRDRYELSTHRIDDMNAAINYLLALRRFQLLLDMKEESEEVKKKALVWKEKMEADHKAGIAS